MTLNFDRDIENTMRKMTRKTNLIFLLSSFCLSGFSQTGDNMFDLYETKITFPNAEVKKNNIRTITAFLIDKKRSKPISKKIYSSTGYLVQNVQYLTNMQDSIVYKITKESDYVLEMTVPFTRRIVESVDAESPLNYLKQYLDIVKDTNILLKKIYKLKLDSSYDVITWVNEEKTDSSHYASTSELLSNTAETPALAYDSSYVKDTLVLKIEKKDEAGNLARSIKYMHKGIAIPVREEYFSYTKDSLVFCNLFINKFDANKRLIFYGEYQGPPLKQYVSEKTTFNDKTGEKTVYHDSNPTSGKPKIIWIYNKNNKLISCTRYYDFNKTKHYSKRSYNTLDLITEEKYFLNDVYENKTVYLYTYF